MTTSVQIFSSLSAFIAVVRVEKQAGAIQSYQYKC